MSTWSPAPSSRWKPCADLPGVFVLEGNIRQAQPPLDQQAQARVDAFGAQLRENLDKAAASARTSPRAPA